MGDCGKATDINKIHGVIKAGKGKPRILQKSLNEYYYARLDEQANEYVDDQKGISYTTSTELEQSQRELACLDNQLAHARAEWMEDKKSMDERWKSCTEMHDNIYKQIPNFNHYYLDSFEKRRRSMERYYKEKELSEIKDREIRKLKKEISCLREVKANTEKRLQGFSVFRTYLEKVKERSHGEYSDIRELIDRYDILAEARTSLGKKDEEARELMAQRQKALETDNFAKSNEVLAYGNYLTEIIDYHDKLKEEADRLDENLLRIKTTAAHRTMIIGQIKMSIDSLYKQICKHMHRAPKIGQSDTLNQLNDIQMSIKELFRLSKDIKHMLKAAFITAAMQKEAREKVLKKEEERQKRMAKLVNRGAKTDLEKLLNPNVDS